MQCYDVMAPPPPYSSCSGRPPPCCPSPAPCTDPGRRPRPAAALRPPGLGRVCRPDSRGSLHDKEGTLRTRPRSRPGSDSAPYLKKMIQGVEGYSQVRGVALNTCSPAFGPTDFPESSSVHR